MQSVMNLILVYHMLVFDSLKDCIADIFYSLITISIFLLYWNAVNDRDNAYSKDEVK